MFMFLLLRIDRFIRSFHQSESLPSAARLHLGKTRDTIKIKDFQLFNIKMSMKLGVALIVSMVVTVTGGSYTIAYDQPCVSNSDCTDPNTYCAHSESPTCAKGKCRCLDYMKWHGGDAKCKVRKYFVDRCNSTLTDCQGGSICSGVNGQCVCNGLTNNYYSQLQRCVTSSTTLKMIGEDCTVAADCHADISGSVECVVPTGSSSSQKKCKCASGYVAAMGSCRKPHYGEACTQTVGCAIERDVPGIDSSIVAETCSSTTNICECPTGSTKQLFRERGYVSNICMNDFDGTLIANGNVCERSNQCTSKICGECPEDTDKKCLAAPSS